MNKPPNYFSIENLSRLSENRDKSEIKKILDEGDALIIPIWNSKNLIVLKPELLPVFVKRSDLDRIYR